MPPTNSSKTQTVTLEDILAEAKYSPRDEGYDEIRSAVDLMVKQATAADPGALAKIDRAAVDRMIAEIDAKISAQVNEVIHHPEFQRLEAAWRGLEYMVDKIDFTQNIRLAVLTCTKSDLLDDFEDAGKVDKSDLFRRVYTDGIGVYGGKPYGLVCANFDFGPSGDDIDLLRRCGAVSTMAHAPFIANSSPEFFGKGEQSFEHLGRLRDMDALFEMPHYARWRSFRESEDARNVGLCMPRFMLRAPYDPGDRRVTAFNFDEQTDGEHANYLWGHASIAFTVRVAASFARYRWCPNIIGPNSGGAVEDLPIHHYETMGKLQTKMPVELQISDRREFELANQGFISLVWQKESDRACFFSANSVQRVQRSHDPELQQSNELGAKLPYMFIVSRMAHYLKIRQRELLGSDMSRSQLEAELNKWIGNYVNNMETTDPKTRASKPLRWAKIAVEDVEGEPGRYSCRLQLRPHFKYNGASFTLSLVGKVDKGGAGS
jgi:type VI secretion system protein ImpC